MGVCTLHCVDLDGWARRWYAVGGLIPIHTQLKPPPAAAAAAAAAADSVQRAR